jgi:glycosyltransferase involved in cell wall biosynthesis
MDAIRAVEQAIASGSKVHLVMVGDGPLRAECESYAKSRNLPVTFAGFFNQKAMPSAYAASDILVMTSVRDETWGLVVNEAMAAGIPAIVSDKVGCAPDLVLPGKTGSVYSAGDHGALASIIADYAGDRARARTEGAAANARVQQYSLDAAVTNTITAAEEFAA